VNNTTAASHTLRGHTTRPYTNSNSSRQTRPIQFEQVCTCNKVITNSPIYINEVLQSQVLHRKISKLTFGTNFVCNWRHAMVYCHQQQQILYVIGCFIILLSKYIKLIKIFLKMSKIITKYLYRYTTYLYFAQEIK
jgi:hypothetical protein